MLTGCADDGKPSGSGGFAYFWSSSTGMSAQSGVWTRYLIYVRAKVGRFDIRRSSLSSVRCKKDN